MAFFSGLNTWKRLIPGLFVYVCYSLHVNSELFPRKLSWVLANCIENHNFRNFIFRPIFRIWKTEWPVFVFRSFCLLLVGTRFCLNISSVLTEAEWSHQNACHSFSGRDRWVSLFVVFQCYLLCAVLNTKASEIGLTQWKGAKTGWACFFSFFWWCYCMTREKLTARFEK